MGNPAHGLRSSNEYGLVFRTAKNYVFNDGNIGIGTDYPEYNLEVQGSTFSKHFTLFDPEVYKESIEGWVLCSNGEGHAYWTDPSLLSDDDWVVKENNVYRMNGNVGIGTSNPNTTLELNKNLSSGGTLGICLANAETEKWFLGLNGDQKDMHDLLIGNFNNLHSGYSSFMVMKSNGNIGLGTDETFGYRLAVNGAIITEEVTVKTKANWPDFVFTEDYELLSLAELSHYIDQHKHLPGIPSAKEVQNDGLNVGEMEGLLLQKIEELSLYIIAQEARIHHIEGQLEQITY
jgi:hypothetical protein